MLKRYCFDWKNTSKIKYNPQFSYKLGGDVQFLSGERLEGLQKIMSPKGRNKNKKFYINTGLHTLKLKVKEGKTKYGAAKVTVSFYKPPEKYETEKGKFTNSYTNNTNMAYEDIPCTHMLVSKRQGDFKSLWFRPFTKNFTREDFKRLPNGKWLKCVVAHVEEAFIVNGEKMLYLQGKKFGEKIVMIKPEVVAVYHIDTPDSKIEVNYLKLYKPLKK